jgi:DNA-binding LytR/AlgR family response regulator
MKLLIVEDEALTAERLAAMIRKYDATCEIVACIPSVEETLIWLKENNVPDLIFMDIHLEDDDCFQIFEQLNVEAPIIFTTAFDEYMVKAFKVNSIDYLMKPINYEELKSALDKYKKTKSFYQEGGIGNLLQSIQPKDEPYKDRFLISNGFKLRTIELPDIQYFYCTDKITFLVTSEGEFLPVEYSLDKLCLLLDPRLFFRINRKVLLSLSAIGNIHIYPKGKLKVDLKPSIKEEVYVSLDRVTAFKEWLGK